MNAPNQVTPSDFTPAEKAAIYAKHRALFTPEKLIEYIEDDDERFPADQVLAELHEMIRVSKDTGNGAQR